jgi:hypothetical protein
VPGGGGWRVRGVDEAGVALDPRQRGAFAPLRATVSFDMWSYGHAHLLPQSPSPEALPSAPLGSPPRLPTQSTPRPAAGRLQAAASAGRAGATRAADASGPQRSSRQGGGARLSRQSLIPVGPSPRCVLFELLMRTSVWHADVDSNLQARTRPRTPQWTPHVWAIAVKRGPW